MSRAYRLIVFCVVSFGGAAVGNVARAQTSGPVASYALSEGTGTTVADTSGNGNAGTLTAPSSWTPGGRFGNGLLLEGDSQGITVPASPALDVASGLTLEAWVCPASIAGYPKILWRDGDGGSPFNLGMAFGNGTLVFNVLTTTGSFSVFAYSSLDTHAWTHVAATYDGAALRIYIDGVLVGSAAASGVIIPSTGDLWLGRAPWGEGFAGRYDEVRIYDRALTAVEIALDRDAQINGLDPPDVGDRGPAPDATGVPPSGVLTATFSRAIDAATLTGSSFYLDGPSGKVPAMLAYDPATHVVTLTPSAPLARLTSYTAHITTDVSDLDEGSLQSPVAWTFTTSPEPALAHAAYAFSEGTGGAAADSSANGNAATLTRPGLWSAAGRYGSGLLLDGAWDGARVTASGSLDVESSLTLETWVYPASIAGYPKLIWRDGLDGSPYSLGMVWGDGSIGFGVTTTAGHFSVYTYRSILPDTWTHIAATYDGSMLRLYVNGQLANASEGAGSIVASTRDLWLGRAPWGEGFAGTLDDVRIYGRALTAPEISVDMGMPATEVTPPAVLSTLPSSGQTSIDPAANIAATFDRPLAEGTVTASAFELRDSSNAVIPASVSYQAHTRTVVLDPNARLADVATYTATLKATITNSAGVALQNEYSWTFTTRNGTPPGITGVSPADGVPFVSLTSTVQVGFSKPLDANSVTAGAIQLLDTRNVPVPGALTYDGQTVTVAFTPAAALLPTRTYTVIVSAGAAGVKDLAGNPLAASYTSTFITTVEPVRLAAGLNHSVAIDDAGQVWTWGGGSLQIGTSLDGRVPGKVTGAAGIVSVAAGASHTLALRADGTLLVWGDNSRGQLGINSTQGSPTPTALASLTNVIAVAGGNVSSMALRSDGTVWTWGFWPQLGGGQTVDSRVPVQVPGLTSVIAIASSDYADYALKADGTVWAWGENTFGQIGDGTNGGGLLRPMPVQVSLLSGIVGIAGGDNHALAVVGSDLSVRAWGSNDVGQLGTGSNNPGLRNAPVAVIGLTDVRHIDGGGLRSVAALLDGTVKTWGSGVTSTGGDSHSPIPVPGNPVGVQVASGLGHGLAVTSAGTVWTWGTNNLGQLGDGTLTNRPTAAAIGDDAYAWKVGRPEFTRASGIYGAAFTVTVMSATPGATIRYTTNGADPTDSDAIVPANPIAINQSQTLKAKAWQGGSPPSAVVTASYILQPDVPRITPGSATYASAPSVSITTSTANTLLRYTVDGTDPTPLSPAYAGPMTVDTFTVLKAKAFRQGWTPSATATATFTLNYGTLAAPVAQPPGGTYASAQVVALEAAGGTQIRYTLDGTDPDSGSTPYVAPVQLPSGSLTLKARAFKVDWTASAAITEAYTITDDTLPPVITASRAPEANLAGWNNTDVTVTFHCADPSGVTVCTAPIRVSGEGYGLPVTGSATDTWGHHASTTWNLNIDRTPPALHVYVPRQSWNFPSSTTSVTIRGGAAELSGLDSVSCDGVEATVTGYLFVCSIGVGAGANNVTIRASDIAGNNASTVISFSVGDVDVEALEISPGTMTMFAGDSREITVTDERGNDVHQGVWSVLDPSIADVSESDGSATVTALAAGQTTLSVAFQGHTAHATISVFAAGSTLPAGTYLWSLNDASGLGVPKRGEVLRATWSAADPDASRAPALLFVDEGTEWQANALVRFDGHPTRIRTTTADGRQLSDVRFAGRMPQQIAADNDGGFVVVLPARDSLPAAIQRFDGRSGSITWEYTATSGYLSDVAIHPDGIIYAAEGHVVGINYLVAITAAGLVHRSPLPHGHYKQIDTGSCGLDSAADTPGYLTGPIILEDGSVALVSTVKVAEQIIYSYQEEGAFNGCAVQSQSQDYSFTQTSHVVQLSSSGPVSIHVLDDSAQRIASQYHPDEWRLMPDGHGGLLLGRRSTPSAIRISPDYRVVASNSTILPADGSTRYETEYVLSEDGAYALVNSMRVISQRPFAYGYESKVVQFDTETLQRISNSDLGVPRTEPQHIRLKFALAGGGVYAVGPSTAYVVNPTVDTAGFAVGGNATHIANGLWSGWDGTGTPWAAPGTEPTIAQNRWAFAAGSENANAPSPRLLTTTRLRELAAERGIGAGLSGIQLNRAIGLAFQGVAIWSLYQREDSNTLFLESPIRQGYTFGAVSHVVPDYLGPYVRGTRPGSPTFLNSVLTEVKAVAGVIGMSYSRYQIRGLVDAATRSPLGITKTNWPMVEFVTTADTLLGLDAIGEATAEHVEIRQRVVLELAGGYLQVGPGRSLNGSWWTMFVSGRTAVPGALPGHTRAMLGTHSGESPSGDPDPPTVEP